MEKNDTFYLGLTMAGAVSAGAYTGGVLDYLFEVLDKWEKAKQGKLEGVDKADVPQHRVVIDAMGGTSAGGMTTSMAVLYAIKNQIKPIKDEDAHIIGNHRNNVFYDSWVNLTDTDQETTIQQALKTDDIKRTGKLNSLLNSDFIDEIAKVAFNLPGDEDQNPAENLPLYISKDLELLISHTMLRGVPLEVNFSSKSTLAKPPSHTSYEHFLVSHFKMNNGSSVDPAKYLWLNPYNKLSSKQLLNATVATGAFPIGLLYREFDASHFSKEYLKTTISRLVHQNMGVENPEHRDDFNWDEEVIDNYMSTSVDGGAINNEPYSEVLSIIKAKRGEPILKKEGKDYQKYGMIMIDPFPDFNSDGKKYQPADSLTGNISRLIKTLWNQSKIKRKEMLDQFNDPAYRGIIFPKKYKVVDGKIKGEYKQPIATGLMGGFSGFLNIKFRHHDFYLGRNNARNYIRAFLSLPYDPDNGVIHPIHREWTEEQRKKFLIKFKGETLLPIIPDMNMLLKGIDSKGESLKYTIPDFPQIPKSAISVLKKGMKKRIIAIVDVFASVKNMTWWKKILISLPFGFFKILRWALARPLAKKAVSFITDELGKYGFIEGVEPEELIKRKKKSST